MHHRIHLAEMRAGGRADICGLSQRTDLNGARVTLMRWDAVSERWAVRCEATGEAVKVRAANLAPVTDATSSSDTSSAIFSSSDPRVSADLSVPNLGVDTEKMRQAVGSSGASLSHLVSAVAPSGLSEAEAQNFEGDLLLSLNDMVGAERCYRKAIELNSTYAAPHNKLGTLLLLKMDVGGAEQCYRNAIKIEPAAEERAQSYAQLGFLLANARNDVDGAEHCYRKGIEADPKCATIHNNLGFLLYFKRHDADGAEKCFRKAIEVDPKKPDAHHSLGRLLETVGKDIDVVEQCYRKSIEIDATYAIAYVSLGSLLKDARKDMDGAKQCYSKAAELNSKWTSYSEMLKEQPIQLNMK